MKKEDIIKVFDPKFTLVKDGLVAIVYNSKDRTANLTYLDGSTEQIKLKRTCFEVMSSLIVGIKTNMRAVKIKICNVHIEASVFFDVFIVRDENGLVLLTTSMDTLAVWLRKKCEKRFAYPEFVAKIAANTLMSYRA